MSRILLVLKENEFIGVNLGEVELELLIGEETVDFVTRNHHVAPAGVEVIEVDLLRLEILGRQPQGIALDPGVDVLGDEDDLGPLLFESQCATDDSIVRRVGIQAGAELLVFFEHDTNASAGLGNGYAHREIAQAPQMIEMADDRSGIAAQVVAVSLEFVEFFEHIERNHHLVICKHEQGIGVMQ